MTHDFFAIRGVWFGLESGLLALAILLLARWIGGRTGGRATWLAPSLGVAFPILLGLQIGNFQIALFALAVLGMLLIAQRRDIAGGAILGFITIAKLSPGVLVVHLFALRRWRAVASCAPFAVFFSLVALLVLGPRPFVDFALYQVPRIASGAAFPWVDEPDSLPVNYGFYALAMNLRGLGVRGMTHEIANSVASVYGVLVLVVAFVAGHRDRKERKEGGAASEASRARQAQTWLALVTLASFRSPFVPDAYAMTGTLWLLTLVAAGASRLSWRAVTASVALALLFSTVLDNNLPSHPPKAVIVFAMVRTLLALSLNLWVIFRPLQPPVASADTSDDEVERRAAEPQADQRAARFV